MRMDASSEKKDLVWCYVSLTAAPSYCGCSVVGPICGAKLTGTYTIREDETTADNQIVNSFTEQWVQGTTVFQLISNLTSIVYRPAEQYNNKINPKWTEKLLALSKKSNETAKSSAPKKNADGCTYCEGLIEEGDEHCYECNHCSTDCCYDDYDSRCVCCCEEAHCYECDCEAFDCACSCCCKHCYDCDCSSPSDCEYFGECFCCCARRGIETSGGKPNTEILTFIENFDGHDDYTKLEEILGTPYILPEIAKFYMLQCADNAKTIRAKFTKDLARKILNYLVISCAGEARYCRNEASGEITWLSPDAQAYVQGIYNNECGGSRESLWILGYRLAQKFGYPRISAMLYEVFDKLKWNSGSYGGSSWANIADTANKYSSGEYNDTIFIDGVMSIVHNGGWAFDKYYRMNFNSYPFSSLLDFKRNATEESIFTLLNTLNISDTSDNITKKLWKEAKKRGISKPEPYINQKPLKGVSGYSLSGNSGYYKELSSTTMNEFDYLKFLIKLQTLGVPLSLNEKELLEKKGWMIG